MNAATEDMVVEMPQSTLPRSTGPCTDKVKESVVVFSTSMETCVALQLALESVYHVTTVTEVEMLIASVTTFKPGIVIIESSSLINMGRLLRLLKRASPAARILFIASPRCLNLAAAAGLHTLLDGIFLEPVGIGDLKGKMNAMLREDFEEEEMIIGPGFH